jgi:putative colanic acid biosynthesis UDP-glucose lipid carrier transferase
LTIFSSLIILSSAKFILRKFLIFIRRKGRNLRSLLIIGAGEVGKNFFDTISDNPHFGYRIVGFLDDKPKAFLNGQYLGKINELDNILTKERIDDIIVALPNYATEKVENVIRTCENHATRIKVIPDYFKFISSKYNISVFGRFPIISIREDRLNEIHWRLLKRGFDTIFSLFLFTFVFSWSWVVIIILQKIQ